MACAHTLPQKATLERGKSFTAILHTFRRRHSDQMSLCSAFWLLEGLTGSDRVPFSIMFSREKKKSFLSGSKYVGEFLNGKRHGKGVKSWPNGDRSGKHPCIYCIYVYMDVYMHIV